MQTPQPTSFPPIVPYNIPPTQQLTSDAILTPNSFQGMAKDKNPVKLPVERFCKDMAQSNMEFLREAEVTDATCYQWSGLMSQYDYLIMCVRLEHAPDPQLRRVWMKIERNPAASPGPGFLSSDARDTVTFSYRLEVLRHLDRDNVTMDCTFTQLKLAHVVHLLEIIWDVCPRHVLSSFNCWFHIAVTLESLHMFGQEWKKEPASDVLRRIVRAMSEKTAADINNQFMDRWVQNAVVPLPTPGPPHPQPVDTAQLEDIQSPTEPLVESPISITDSLEDGNPPLHWRMNRQVSQQPAMDGKPLSTIIWKNIIQENDSNNADVLLALSPVIVTNEHLFATLRWLFQDPPDAHIQLRVLNIIRLWVLGEHFSSDMVPNVSRFIDTVQPDTDAQVGMDAQSNDGSQDVEDIRSTLQRLQAHVPSLSLKAPILEWDPSNAHSDANLNTPSQSSKSPLLIKQLSFSSFDGISADTRVRDINKKHIQGLARAFAQIEIQSRSTITVAKIVKGILRDRQEEMHDFSQLSLHIREWVFYSVLRKGIQHRAVVYSKLVEVAKECYKMKNYATATDLVAALGNERIRNLKLTMTRVSRDTRKQLVKLEARLNPASDSISALKPGVIHSWNFIIKLLHDLIDNAKLKQVVKDAQPSIFWTNCNSLHSELEEAVKTLSSGSSSYVTHGSFRTFLVQELQKGWKARGKRDGLAMKLAEGESDELYQEQMEGVGTRVG